MSSAASAPKKNILVAKNIAPPQGQGTTINPTFYGINKVTPPKASGRTVARNKGDKSSPPIYTTGTAANPAASPPIQAETNFQNHSNPQTHVKIPYAASEGGDVRASAVMAYSMKRTTSGIITPDKPLSRQHNTNAAPPFLQTYGSSTRSGNNSRPETSVYAHDGGGPVLLSTHSGKDRATKKV